MIGIKQSWMDGAVCKFYKFTFSDDATAEQELRLSQVANI